MRTSLTLALTASLLTLAPACGPGIDREETLQRLHSAMGTELPQGDTDTLEEHNQLVEQVRDGNVLDGMRRSEVEEALGRGQECASRPVCSEHGFNAGAWVYEIGRREGVAWGPTVIIGFDRQGVVDNVYTLTRR